MIIQSSQDSDMAAVIEITPMIDMVFLLLVFFLVATTFQDEEREIDIALPVASSGAPISEALRDIIINVKSDGAIVVAGRSRTPDELRELISVAAKRNPAQKVTVRGDREAAYAHIVGVLDICKTAGIQQPYLDTRLTP